MWFNKNLQELLDGSAKLSSGNTLFITDLENVLYVTTGDDENTKEQLYKPMSNELQHFLTEYELDTEEHSPIILNNHNIAIYKEDELNTIFKSLMIFPIIINDKVYGSIVSASYHKVFEEKHIKFARTTIMFVTQNIIDFLNSKIAGEITIDSLDLFYEINLDYVSSLLDEKRHLLDDANLFPKFKSNYAKLYKHFESSLSEEEMKKFKEFIHYRHKQNEYENALCFFMGMKISNNILKL